jgi:8-oxo-dGTP diphosphatase
MDQPSGVDVRCSTVVFRDQEILLVGRIRGRTDEWVLPGGTPRPGESMAACARRETVEETGLAVEPTRIAFVLESRGPRSGLHTVDLVFLAAPPVPGQEPRSSEPDLNARFVPLDLLPQLDLRPPVAGHLRALHGRTIRTAAYLGNLWRPRHHDDLPPTLLEFTAEPGDEMPSQGHRPGQDGGR